MYQFVDTDEALNAAVDALAPASHFFIDTEFESTRGGTTLCLLQISDGHKIYLFDALKLSSLVPLRDAIADEGKEWVLHAGQQDLPLIQSSLDIGPHHRVFDTQVAWALSGPEHSVSLSYLVYRILGKRAAKSHQADDWKRRPLPTSQLEYAASDVQPLPAIHQALCKRLSELGRLHLVHEITEEQLRPQRETVEWLDLSSFRNAWQLDPRQQAALQYLIGWFNGLPPKERRNAPDTKVLLSIARRVPKTTQDLCRIKGVPQRWANAGGRELVRALSAAVAAADSADFHPLDPTPYATFDDIQIDAWLQMLRARLSTQLEIAPELTFPGRLLRDMRRALMSGGPERSPLDVLDGWRRSVLGEALEHYLQSTPPPELLREGTP